MLTTVVLVLLGVQFAVGLLVLLRWLRARRPATPVPTGLVAAHLLVALAGTALWVVFVVADQPVWAWVALVVVLTGNGLGDLVLAGRWRLDVATRGRWVQDWWSAVKDLADPRRRVNALHAALAGVVSVLMLVEALRAGW